MRRHAAVGLLLALACGCAGRDVGRAVLADRSPAARHADLAARYTVRCPDVLEVRVGAAWRQEAAVGSDGRLDLGEMGQVRVDGLTAAEATLAVAALLRVPHEGVAVRVARFESQQVYLHGEVSGLQRAVPYMGPETVLDLLQRVGGLAAGAAPADVQVVRPHVADGKAPEVFTVDLRAIVLEKNAESDLRLQPFDQVYVGQSRRSCFSQCLPRWLRPLFDGLVGLEDEAGERRGAPR